MLSRFVIASFSSKEQASFNFTAAVTICSDFGAQENAVCHCFHCFPVDHNKLWKILKEIRLPDHLKCLLKNLYTVQYATVKTRHGTFSSLRAPFSFSRALINLLKLVKVMEFQLSSFKS